MCGGGGVFSPPGSLQERTAPTDRHTNDRGRQAAGAGVGLSGAWGLRGTHLRSAWVSSTAKESALEEPSGRCCPLGPAAASDPEARLARASIAATRSPSGASPSGRSGTVRDHGGKTREDGDDGEEEEIQVPSAPIGPRASSRPSTRARLCTQPQPLTFLLVRSAVRFGLSSFPPGRRGVPNRPRQHGLPRVLRPEHGHVVPRVLQLGLAAVSLGGAAPCLEEHVALGGLERDDGRLAARLLSGNRHPLKDRLGGAAAGHQQGATCTWTPRGGRVGESVRGVSEGPAKKGRCRREREERVMG